MTQEEIKKECEVAYEQIKKAQSNLESLRAQCLHSSTYEGNYSYRIGNIQPAIICSDCGSLVKFTNKYEGI